MKRLWPRRSVDGQTSLLPRGLRPVWSSRLSRVWLVSIVARATVVPVALFAASALRDDNATVLALVALSGSGVLATIIGFLFDARFADGRTYSKRVYSAFLGIIMVVTVTITTLVAHAGPIAGLIVLLANAALRPTVEARQRLLHNGALLMPYLAVALRNLSLVVLLAVGRDLGGRSAAVAIALAFLGSGLLELTINRLELRRVGIPDAVAMEPTTGGIVASLSLPIAYTLFCTMPWMFRVVIATFVGVDSLKVVEYADRLSYLAVSIVLGGAVTELQRRWTKMPSARTAYREACALAAVLLGIGLASGVVASLIAPLVITPVRVSERVTILLLGLAAGAWGAITVAQRLLITGLKHLYLARNLIPFEVAASALVITGGYFGLLGATAMYAVSLVALAILLFRPQGDSADAVRTQT